MQKWITFTVPCYNSEAYLDRCVQTLLPAGEHAEVLLIDDGSKDKTGEMADAYAAKYPNIVRVIHQENGGHGEGVNQGVRHAQGLYMKVVDSDDWLDGESLQKLMTLLGELDKQNTELDLIIHDYVYEMTHKSAQTVYRYDSCLKPNQRFTWEEQKQLPFTQLFMMHSLIYRTRLLRDCNLELPKHTFYVDNIYIYHPLPHTCRLYYLNVPLYRYFLGREDQSVNEKVIMTRLPQHTLVAKLMATDYTEKDLEGLPRSLKRYMVNACGLMMATTSALLFKAGTPEALAMYRDLWRAMREHDQAFYRTVKHSPFGIACTLPGALGRRITVLGYDFIRRRMKF